MRNIYQVKGFSVPYFGRQSLGLKSLKFDRMQQACIYLSQCISDLTDQNETADSDKYDSCSKSTKFSRNSKLSVVVFV